MKYKNIFLDFDGTVTRSEKGIVRAFQYMFDKIGMESPQEEEIKRYIGPPVKYILKKLFGIEGQKNDDAYALFREYYAQKGIYEMELYEGMKDLLEALKQSGAAIHLATGKRGPQAATALEYLNIRDYFTQVFGAEIEYNIVEKKDIIKKALQTLGHFPESPVMVGDRDIDIIGGRENDFATIGVLYGYGDEAEIIGAKPDHIAADVEKLKNILLTGS